MNKLRRLEDEAASLNLKEMRRLDAFLHVQIRLLEEEEESGRERQPHQRTGSEILTLKKAGAVTYQLELVKCGKENCRCAKGKGHGPYWYKYWSQGGKTKSAYIGKKLPKEISDTASSRYAASEQSAGRSRKVS